MPPPARGRLPVFSRACDPDMDGPITSPQNARIKAVAALRDRRDRERQGRIIIDGAREILRALQSGMDVEEVFICEPLCRSDDCRAALAEASRNGVRRIDVGERAFDKLAFGDRADGVVAVARAPSVELRALRLGSDPFVVVLEGVEKPGNLGAVLRSADAAGADALIAAGGTDLFNPNAIRASLGTIFHVPVAAGPTPEVIAWLREQGLRILAARVDGARLYTQANLTGPVAVVLGSEASGLGAAWSAEGIEAVRLPMHGMADSLNVSAAAAVLLYEARRQRDEGHAPTTA
jgi:TrmH family RNA methyltransferase